MKKGDIILEKNEIVQEHYLRDQELVADVRRHQRHEMLNELMNLDGLPFAEAMTRIERWEETRHDFIDGNSHVLPPHMRPKMLRLQVVVNKP